MKQNSESGKKVKKKNHAFFFIADALFLFVLAGINHLELLSFAL